jgi:hypothetical protein
MWARISWVKKVGDVQCGADGRAGPEVWQGKRAAIRESSINPFLKQKMCEATRASCALHVEHDECNQAATK